MRDKKGGPWRMLAAVTLVVLAFACGCAGQEATVDDAVDHGGELSSEGGQIAFTRLTNQTGMDIEADIYAINVDGSGERRLTDTPGLDGFPSWSPDGQRIAFVSDRAGGNWEIYVMNSDGTHQRHLTNTPQEDEAVPAWSPDGERIAYATDFDGDSKIWVMTAHGSDRKQLARGLFPSWSPDGKRIAYTTYSGNRPYLAVINADGSERRSLGASALQKLLGMGGGEEPAWSPDGERIAYVFSRSEDNEEIYVMASNGSERTRRLTDIPGHDHWPPTWSPDGNRIAFTSDGTEGNPEIYVMNSDGSGLTKLTDDPANDAFPAWRP
jgi:Tol biopolymer transport system component